MTPPLPGDRTDGPRSPLTVPLLTAVLAALAVAAAVFAGPEPARGALAVTGTVAGLLLCAAVTVADRAVASARAARTRLDTVTEDLGRLLKEQNRLTEEHTAELARLTEERTAERARLTEEHTATTDRLTEEHTATTDRLTEEHAAHVARLDARLREAESARAAALSATANAAGRMQALATGMLADLRAMEDKHHDEEVLADLLHLDHRTAQAGRLADSVAVLTGARSGRRWARPIAMESILRGAMGRIGGYQRVRAHSASDTAVAGHAAEGVMHALAELLDNAANFSPPTAEVHVYVEEVPSGIIVSVEDSGLVMSDVQLRRAERAVSGESTDLGGLTGTRLGLAVVGRLARRYGLKVSYRPSARGGTSALMLIPQELLVTTGASAPESTGTAPAATSSATTARAGEATATTATAPAGEATTTPATTATAATAAIAARTAPAIPSEEPAAAAARAADRPAPPAEPTAEPTSAGLPRRRSSRTKPAPAAPDHRHDPVPEHESAAPDGEAPPLVLPRRRRGRTLADAERTWSAGRTADPRPAPTAEETRARTARFSSFRRAVRPTTAAPTGDDAPARPATAPTAPTADDVRAGRDTDTPPAAQNNPTTPEGDTTS